MNAKIVRNVVDRKATTEYNFTDKTAYQLLNLRVAGGLFHGFEVESQHVWVKCPADAQSMEVSTYLAVLVDPIMKGKDSGITILPKNSVVCVTQQSGGFLSDYIALEKICYQETLNKNNGKWPEVQL